MENQIESSIFDLQIDQEGSTYLTEIAKWAKLFSILGIIAGILIVLAGMRGLGPFVGVLSVMFGAIYLYPSWLLLKFATGLPAGINKGDQALVNESFKNLKSCFKFWGIVSLVIIGLYILIFILGLLGSAV